MRTRLYVFGLAMLIAGLMVAAVPTGEASATGNVHCVKYGETLYGIAARYGTSAYALAHANGIYNPNYVRAGQCLTIPAGYGYGHGYQPSYGHDYGYKKPTYGYPYDYGYKPGYGQGYKPGYGHGKGNVYCLRYGDTLYGVAYRYGVSVWSLAHANGIYNPNYVRAGQCVTIPGW